MLTIYEDPLPAEAIMQKLMQVNVAAAGPTTQLRRHAPDWVNKSEARVAMINGTDRV